MEQATSSAVDRMAMILHSGAYDRVSYALSMAIIGLALGWQVDMLLTYGGLRRFTKGNLGGLGEETGVAERKQIERGLSTGGIKPLEAYLADARALNLKIHACPNAMAALNISRDQLVPEVDQVTGLTSFLETAQGAMTWYV